MAGKKRPFEKSVRMFWENTHRGSENECWLWVGPVFQGRGRWYFEGRNITAHKFAMMIYLGKKIPAGKIVFNHCNQLLCVNPNHLYLGDVYEQIRVQLEEGNIGAKKKTQEGYINLFWSCVEKKSPQQCWFWKGSRKNTYGRFWTDRGTIGAHRFSLELKLGRILRQEDCALHSCDNKSCVNPDHLFVGSSKENFDDKVSKGRQARGINHGMSKLDDEKVREIRELYCTGMFTHKELADRYNVTEPLIFMVIHKKIWRHVL